MAEAKDDKKAVEPTEVNDAGYRYYYVPEFNKSVKARTLAEAVSKAEKQATKGSN